jgi:hypothetical protein
VWNVMCLLKVLALCLEKQSFFVRNGLTILEQNECLVWGYCLWMNLELKFCNDCKIARYWNWAADQSVNINEFTSMLIYPLFYCLWSVSVSVTETQLQIDKFVNLVVL